MMIVKLYPYLGEFILLCCLVAANNHVNGLSNQGSSNDYRPDFGHLGMDISCTSEATQQYFNDGLVHEFGFNQAEARRNFRKCIESSPNCAMCRWGLAYAYGPFLNKNASTPLELGIAGRASSDALSIVNANPSKYTFQEQRIIKATFVRFQHGKLNEVGYCDELRKAIKIGQNSIGAVVGNMEILLAESLMNQVALDYYFHEVVDQNPTTLHWRIEAIEARKLLLTHANDNQLAFYPLGLHLFIHLTEPATPGNGIGTKYAKFGEHAAESLANLDVVGSGHLEHMPGHLFLRVGRYNDAIIANERAHAADVWYEQHNIKPYGIAHNCAFLVFAACMDGQYRKAVHYANILRSVYITAPERHEVPNADEGYNSLLTTYLRFGQWKNVIQDQSDIESQTTDHFPFSWVMRHYSKALAFNQLGNHKQFAQEMHLMQQVIENEYLEVKEIPLAKVANFTLSAAYLTMEQNYEEAVRKMEQALDLQLAWKYIEPPPWYYPVRQCLGTALLNAKQYCKAKSVFEADLLMYPDNAWSLLGMHLSSKECSNGYSGIYLDRAHESWSRSTLSLPTSPCKILEVDAIWNPVIESIQ